MRSRPTTLLAAAGLIGAVALAACAPGSNSDSGQAASPTGQVTTDPSKLGDVTLTVWDQEVRGGQAAQIEELNKQFQAKYPNITIKRVSRSFDDLKTTLRLALSGNEPPDVVQANNGRSDMGAFVKAGQLVPAGRVCRGVRAGAERYPESVRSTRRYSTDGKTFGEGNLYGLPQVGEVVGIFVQRGQARRSSASSRRRRGPSSRTRLATAKAKGEVPMRARQPRQVAGHPRVRHRAGPERAAPTRSAPSASGSRARSWNTPENTKAAADRWSTGSTRATSPRASTASATTRRGRRSPRATASS